MTQTKEIIDFYSKGIEKYSPLFSEKICSIAHDAEKLNEVSRQILIMEDMMKVFDEVSCRDIKENSIWEMFKGFDEDELTNFQLETIKELVKIGYPNVAKSCDKIIKEGF